MGELEEIKRKRLEELQRAYSGSQTSSEFQEELQMQQQIEAIESVAKQSMSKEALQRYGNLKAAQPEKAIQLAVIIARAMEAGKVTGLVSDEQLKGLLAQMTPAKRKTTIIRK